MKKNFKEVRPGSIIQGKDGSLLFKKSQNFLGRIEEGGVVRLTLKEFLFIRNSNCDSFEVVAEAE